MGSLWSKPWKKTDIDKWNEEVLQKLTEDIKTYKDRNVNFLLFGGTGQGKSAFVNTLFSALYGEQKTVAPEGTESAASITQGVQRYRLKESVRTENWNISIIDMEGVERKDNVDDIISILNGIIDSRELSEETRRYMIDEKVHAVLFCYMYNENMEISNKDNFFKTCVVHACRKGIPVFLLMTQIDKSCTDGIDISRVFYDQDLLQATKTAARTFGVPEKNVLLQCNYSQGNNSQTDLHIDILTLFNLRFILSNIIV